jgi:hypothetical protein
MTASRVRISLLCLALAHVLDTTKTLGIPPVILASPMAKSPCVKQTYQGISSDGGVCGCGMALLC